MNSSIIWDKRFSVFSSSFPDDWIASIISGFSVFTGVKGYLDNVDLNNIKKFEKDLIEKIKSDKPEIIDSLQSSGKLEENTEKLLTQVIEEYKKGNK